MAGARKPGRNFLFVPGPTNVPDRILRAMHVAMEDHRSSDFPKLTLPLYEDLKRVFKTRDSQVVIFPSSGTGAWEAVLTNTCSPGDKLLASRFGQFSHLWIELARRHGLEVVVQEEEWGTGANPERIEEALREDKNHEIKGVLVVHNETATGVTSDVAAVRRAMDAANHPALLFVDGVSSIASIDFRFDEWGVDLAITGSQKGLMLPAGLGIVCASQKSLAAMKDTKCRKSYFDLADQMSANAAGYFPCTPALPLLHGLREALEGARECLRAASPPCRRRTRRGPRVGTEALRPGPEMAFRHRDRDYGATRLQRRRCDRPRLSPLQSRARRGSEPSGRQAIPHRPFGRFERVDAARRHCRRRDGHARRRHRGRAWPWSGGGPSAVPRNRARS